MAYQSTVSSMFELRADRRGALMRLCGGFFGALTEIEACAPLRHDSNIVEAMEGALQIRDFDSFRLPDLGALWEDLIALPRRLDLSYSTLSITSGFFHLIS